MDKLESLFSEWLISGEESKFLELLSWGPSKDLIGVPEMLSKSWGLSQEQCNSNPELISACTKVFKDVQVGNFNYSKQ